MRDVMKHLGSIHDGDSLKDLIELSTCGHSVLNSLVVEYLEREGEDRFRYLGWVNDEKYWLREIVGVGERILPADCFGNPILSKRED
jgi:hypothetical protein